MFIDLSDHHVKRLVPIVEARLSLLRKRVLKEFGSNWYDYDDEGKESKIEANNDEYFRLKQVLKKLNNQ